MLKDILGEGQSRTLRIAGITLAGNIILGLGKLFVGIFSASFFICVSAFYTFGMVIAKCFALNGIVKSKPEKQQSSITDTCGNGQQNICSAKVLRQYRRTAVTLITASLVYIGYSMRLFYYPATSDYSIYTGLIIAVFTFTELVLNIRGVIIERKNKSPLFHALKTVSLASSLICLVLTQTAILSFADSQTDLQPSANGFMGVLMGAAAAVLGILMLVRAKRLKRAIKKGN